MEIVNDVTSGGLARYNSFDARNVHRVTGGQVIRRLAVAKFSDNMTDTRCFAGPRLPFEDHRLAGTANIKQYLVVVWRGNKRKLGEALRSEHFFEQ